jgi:hexosaminidase
MRAVPQPAPLPPVGSPLTTVEVCVADASEALGSGTDESHTVSVPADGPAVVSAKTIYGAMRGLETLTQLVDVRVGKEGGASIPSCPVEISDAPR